MIGTVDVAVQALNPSMPLYPMRAFVSSPTSIRVRNVPKRIGKWAIESVQFVAAYPDGSIKTAQCVLTGGVWVGTIEGTSTSGTSTNGYTIFASGTDENGNAVTGYVLGKGDIEILEADGTLNPDAPSYYVHLLSAQSETPKEGDLYPTLSGYMIWQDGEGHALGTNLTDEQIDTLDADVERRETIVKLQGNITKTFYWTGTVTKQTLADAELYDQTQQTFAAITEIEFGTGVETIDSQLFTGCTTLEKVKFPSSLVEVGTSAFKNCTILRTISLPKFYARNDGGNWMGGTFEGCTNLYALEIPGSLKKIPPKMFYNCTTLHEVEIGDGVQEIGPASFLGTQVGTGTAFYIPSSVKRINGHAFRQSKISNVTLNEGLEYISNYAFQSCTNLTEITIPSTAYVDGTVFVGCTSLQKIVFKGKSLRDLTEDPAWPYGLTTAQQTLVETFNDRIVDGNGNIIRADRTCKSGATWNWYISGTNRMIGTKTDSYYINEEETQKYVLQYSDSPFGWTCSIYTKSGDDWVLQNSEHITNVTNLNYLCFSTIATDMAWLQSSEDEILATQNWVTSNYTNSSDLTSLLAAKRDLTDMDVRGAPSGQGSWFTVDGIRYDYDAEDNIWRNGSTQIWHLDNIYYISGPDIDALFELLSDFTAIVDGRTIIGYVDTLATENWVEGKNYLSAIPNTYKTYNDTLSSLSSDGYATQNWVEGKNYLTSVPNMYKTYSETVSSLSNDGYATETYVDSIVGDINTVLDTINGEVI